MSFQIKFPVQSPILTRSPPPAPDFDSCLFCYANIIPNVSPFEEGREALVKRAHLLKNLFYHLGYSMAFLPEECQRSNYPVCCCCVDKIHKMWFHFYETMKIACGIRDTVVECVAAGKRYVPKQENENFTKMREVIVNGALFYTCIPVNSDPQQFLQQVQKIVDYEALGSGNSAPETNGDAHTENMRSTVEIAARALGIPMPIPLCPASSSSSTSVDQVADSVPRSPLSLNVPVAGTSGLQNHNASLATTSCQSTRPSPFNFIECNKCQKICFTKKGFENHLTECQPSRPTTNGEQSAATATITRNEQQCTSSQSNTPVEDQSTRSGDPSSGHFKCSICSKSYKTKHKCRDHERWVHQVFRNRLSDLSFKCRACEKIYGSPHDRCNHERIHHKILSFEVGSKRPLKIN